MRLPSFRGLALVTLGTALIVTAPLARAEKPAPLADDGIADLSRSVADAYQKMRDTLAPAAPPRPAAPAAATAPAQGIDSPIVGAPEPSGYAITGRVNGLMPSEQLAGRQAALRFHFQQQMQTGERPWLPATPRY